MGLPAKTSRITCGLPDHTGAARSQSLSQLPEGCAKASFAAAPLTAPAIHCLTPCHSPKLRKLPEQSWTMKQCFFIILIDFAGPTLQNALVHHKDDRPEDQDRMPWWKCDYPRLTHAARAYPVTHISKSQAVCLSGGAG